jgi:hypothetical protein
MGHARGLCPGEKWQTELGVDIPVAVNLSARQFRRNDLLASVQLVLDETGLPSRLLELEITEGLLMVDPIGAIDIIRGLNFLGVKTALDDFGTGYSSLAYLKAFRSTASRSTAPLSATCRTTKAIAPFPTRSSPSASTSTWKCWPKASKRKPSAISWPNPAARHSRAICSASRCPVTI